MDNNKKTDKKTSRKKNDKFLKVRPPEELYETRQEQNLQIGPSSSNTQRSQRERRPKKKIKLCVCGKHGNNNEIPDLQRLSSEPAHAAHSSSSNVNRPADGGVIVLLEIAQLIQNSHGYRRGSIPNVVFSAPTIIGVVDLTETDDED